VRQEKEIAMGRFLVLGIDDPDESAVPLQWAAAEAARRRLPLRLLHTQPQMLNFPSEYELMRRELREGGERLLATAGARVAELAPDVEVQTVVELDSEPAEALLEQAAEAELLVLGSSGRSAIGDLLAPSATPGVIRRAPCPVVVVRTPRDGSAGLPEGPVVVGVDGSELSAGAVALAFREASVWETSLVAVHAWSAPSVAFTERAAYGLSETDTVEPTRQVHAALLSESLAGWREKHPDVEVVERLVQAHPSQALIDASADARLLVTGTRGRGGFAGMLLGSVSSAALHHAHCPVMISRATPSGR
jgi:nucleotide-binding universal stress UspA family protein